MIREEESKHTIDLDLQINIKKQPPRLLKRDISKRNEILVLKVDSDKSSNLNDQSLQPYQDRSDFGKSVEQPVGLDSANSSSQKAGDPQSREKSAF